MRTGRRQLESHGWDSLPLSGTERRDGLRSAERDKGFVGDPKMQARDDTPAHQGCLTGWLPWTGLLNDPICKVGTQWRGLKGIASYEGR